MINRTKGFTLIELMVVVAIIGVISAIAFPSYNSYMKKSRRADAKVALTVIADRQERFYLQNNSYSTTLTGINMAATSDEGYYTLVMNAGSATAFKATATAVDTTDTQCASLSIDSVGARTSNGGTGDANNCW